MVLETNELFRLAEGRYKFTIIGVPEKFKTPSGAPYRRWSFVVLDKKGENIKLNLTLFPSQYNEILIACGVANVQGNTIQWDDNDVDGKEFFGDLVFEKKSGKSYKRIVNVRSLKEEEEFSGIPF